VIVSAPESLFACDAVRYAAQNRRAAALEPDGRTALLLHADAALVE